MSTETEAGSATTLGVKDAVAAAVRFLQEMYEGQAGYAGGLMLEELEYDEARENWRVTLGFDRELESRNLKSTLAQIGGAGKERQRVYKSVVVDGRSGDVKSMKIRSVD